MRRLVYAPNVQAFVKADSGVVDISPYIVRGSVSRKLNQVSSAQLTLRNPVASADRTNLLFTEFVSAQGAEPGPMFHPMDPIIIVMQRLQNHPVQVFTGYLDKVPYIQLYPGLCSLTASCTLKRLLYTQWDAVLPAVQKFLYQYGWATTPDGLAVNPTASASTITGANGKLQGQFNDGSIGALLFGVMNQIGDWDHSTIWIEALPPEIAPLVEQLYKHLAPTVQDGATQFLDLIKNILGQTSQGTGGGGGGGAPADIAALGKITRLDANQRTFLSTLSSDTGLDPVVLAAWLLQEGGNGGRSSFNYLNIGFFDTGPGAIAFSTRFGDPTSGGHASAQFLQGKWGGASQGILAILSTSSKSPEAQIAAIQRSGWATSGEPLIPSIYATLTAQVGTASRKTTATNTKNQTKSHAGSSAPAATAHKASDSPTASAAAVSHSGAGHQAGRSPGGKTGTTSGASGGGSNLLSNIFGAGTKGTRERADMGVDFAFPDGTKLGPIGAGTVSVTTSTGFDGQPLMMVVLDQPINGYKAWYISEGIKPVRTSGHVVPGIDQIAVVENHGTGLETGWADPKTGYPAADPHYSEGDVTQEGRDFASAIGVPALPSGNSAPITVTGTGTVGGNATGSGSASGGTSSTGGTGAGAAFATYLNLPTIFNLAQASLFTGKRSFMADQPLFPFIDQLCKASLRNFCSMPNGNFFAFFPDYFGFFGRKFYWEINDIEIIDARVDLSDDALLTNVGVAGDTFFAGSVTLEDKVYTAGIFDIFDAISTGYVGNNGKIVEAKKYDPLTGKTKALAFLQKYGVRSLVEEVPMIRSPFFELFLAFQNFMLAWAKQFQTTFELTFMPELFPGGLIGLPDHHLQLYIEEVEHSFDYEQGFSTMINVSSPSALPDDPHPSARTNLSHGLARNGLFANLPEPKPKPKSKTKAR